MKVGTFFSRVCDFGLIRHAAIMLVVLAWGGLAFGDEIGKAILDGNLDRVRALLKDNPDLVFRKNTSGDTPLFLAANVGQTKLVELLLTNKSDVNAKESIGMTALHCAAMNGYKTLRNCS
ncbi:MAG TPA: ankyrin repeat domain-containing protein [Verrucomicrobiae bacterium]